MKHHKILMPLIMIGISGIGISNQAMAATSSMTHSRALQANNDKGLMQIEVPKQHKWYVGADLGYSISANNVNFHPSPGTWIVPYGGWPSNANFGNSPMYGLFVGYNLNPSVSVDLTYDYRGSFQYDQSGAISFASPGERFLVSTISIQTLILSLNLSPSDSWNGFKPYVSAGFGIALNKVGQLENADLFVASSSYTPQYDITVSGRTQINFVWKAGLGVTYALNNQFHFNLGYRLTYVGTMKTGSSAYDSVNQVASSQNPFVAKNVFLNEVSLGLAYDFA